MVCRSINDSDDSSSSELNSNISQNVIDTIKKIDPNSDQFKIIVGGISAAVFRALLFSMKSKFSSSNFFSEIDELAYTSNLY